MEPDDKFLTDDGDSADEIGGDLDREMVARSRQWERDGLTPPWSDSEEPLSEWETMPYVEPTQAEIDEILSEAAAAPSRCEQCDISGRYNPTVQAFTCCCRACGEAPMVPIGFEMCASCMHDRLCRICGVEPKVAHGRCDTCRKYFDRTGRERPREMRSRTRITAADLADRHEQRRRNHDEWDRHVKDAWLW